MSNNTVTLGTLLAEYEGAELELLPVGEYQVEIVSVRPRATDVVPTYKVVAGPYAGKRTMGGSISCNGNAAPRFFARMKEIGLDKAFFQSLGAEHLPVAEVMKAVAEAMKGRIVNISFTQEEPNKHHSDWRNKLEKFTALISAPAAVPTAGAVPQIPVTPAATPAPSVVPVAPPSEAPAVPAVPVAAVPQAPQAPQVAAVVAPPAAPAAPAAPTIPVAPAAPEASPAQQAAQQAAAVPGVPQVGNLQVDAPDF